MSDALFPEGTMTKIVNALEKIAKITSLTDQNGKLYIERLIKAAEKLSESRKRWYEPPKQLAAKCYREEDINDFINNGCRVAHMVSVNQVTEGGTPISFLMVVFEK